MAAFRLLLRIGLDLCANVRYIIDRNPQCLAGRLGIEVISPNHALEHAIDAIVRLPHPTAETETMFLGKDELAELCGGQATIIDIYEYLAENGCACVGNFWEMELTDEDIDVGFPAL